jgi:hypothetical protein
MGYKCCANGEALICGGPGLWDLGDNNPAILFCPWCGTELPKTAIIKFEVVVRYNRGLGPEFKKVVVEAETIPEAKAKGEKEASDLLAGSKFTLLGSQATPIKA